MSQHLTSTDDVYGEVTEDAVTEDMNNRIITSHYADEKQQTHIYYQDVTQAPIQMTLYTFGV